MDSKVEYYRDFSGCTASIRKWGKQFWLRIKSPNGIMTVQSKRYNTYRGAKIAMGIAGQSWTLTGKG